MKLKKAIFIICLFVLGVTIQGKSQINNDYPGKARVVDVLDKTTYIMDDYVIANTELTLHADFINVVAVIKGSAFINGVLVGDPNVSADLIWKFGGKDKYVIM